MVKVEALLRLFRQLPCVVFPYHTNEVSKNAGLFMG